MANAKSVQIVTQLYSKLLQEYVKNAQLIKLSALEDLNYGQGKGIGENQMILILLFSVLIQMHVLEHITLLKLKQENAKKDIRVSFVLIAK